MTKTITLLVFLFAYVSAGYAEVGISVKEKIIIHDKAFILVKEYQDAINRIGNEISDITRTKGNIEKLISLYVNRKIMVYNDLDPAHQLSEFYEIETYGSNLALWYPDGQTVTLDMENATVSDIMEHGENIFSIDIVVSKKIKGNYLNQTLNSNIEKLLIRVAFVIENQKPDKFKIAGIRSATGEIKPLDNLSMAEIKSVNLDKNVILKIEANCKSLANDYSNYLALLGNESETAEDKELYKSAVKNIFITGENNIFNDLEENPTDKYIGIDEYIGKYTVLYPSINNVSLNTDSANFSKVIKSNDSIFNLYMYTNKFFSAKQKGKGLFRFQNKMIIKIICTKKNETFTNFKIESIDNQGINEALTSSSSKIQDIKTFSIFPKLSKQGLYISFNLNAGLSNVVNKNIAELEFSSQSHEWKIKPKFSYGGQIRILYMINNLIGFETGVGYQSIKSNYSLSSNGVVANQTLVDSSGLNAFVDNTPYQLNAGDTYYKIIQVPSYDSTVSIQAITLPIFINALYGSPKKISFRFKIGLELMYMLKSTYSVTGQKKYFAYLPNPQVEYENFHFLYAEQDVNNAIGLYDKTINKQEQKAPLNKLAINGVAYFGLNIPMGYFLLFNAGVVYKLGLTDLSQNNFDYTDIFGETRHGIKAGSNHVLEHKPTKLQQYFIELGITYKF